MVVIGLAAAAVSVSLLAWHLAKRKQQQQQQQLVPEKSKKDVPPQSSTPLKKQPNKSTNKAVPVDTDPTPRRTNTTSAGASTSNPLTRSSSVATEATAKSTSTDDEKAIHSKIEEFDKKGKALFKSKKVRPRSATSLPLSCVVSYVRCRLRQDTLYTVLAAVCV